MRTFFCLLLAACSVLGQRKRISGWPEIVPLDDWIKEGKDANIRWSLRVFPPHLGEYQRLDSYIWADVNASEAARRSNGQLMVEIEIFDHDRHSYLSRGSHFRIKKGTNPDDVETMRFIQQICLTPGDYEVVGAIYDSETGEHNLKRSKLRVPPIHRDPFPNLWRGLPEVEFSSCRPRGAHRLYLPVETASSIRMDIIANRPDVARGDTELHPRLDVISQMQISDGTIDLSLLDLENRVAREQQVTANFDPNHLWRGMPASDRDKIDAHVLENSSKRAQFFVSEIRKHLERTVPGKHVLIVLSDPKKFPKQESRPIQMKRPANTILFYIRCRPPAFFYAPGPESLPPDPPDWSTPPELPSGPAPKPPPPPSADSLEQTLKPLEPVVFDVTTPMQFRNALGEIIRRISQLH